MKERQEERLSPLPKIGEGFGEWFEALLRMKEGWVVVKKEMSLLNILKEHNVVCFLKCLGIICARGSVWNWAEPLLFVVTPKEEIADGILIHLRFQHPAEPRWVRSILIATFRHS